MIRIKWVPKSSTNKPNRIWHVFFMIMVWIQAIQVYKCFEWMIKIQTVKWFRPIDMHSMKFNTCIAIKVTAISFLLCIKHKNETVKSSNRIWINFDDIFLCHSTNVLVSISIHILLYIYISLVCIMDQVWYSRFFFSQTAFLFLREASIMWTHKPDKNAHAVSEI